MLDNRRIEESFSMIYVTLTSVLLGLAIEDLVSQVRETETWDLLLVGVALNGVTLSVAVWTGYAFIAITQVRRPHVLDSLNVFGLALGIFALNSSIGRPPAYFFTVVGVYNLISIYAVHYNVGLFQKSVPFEMGWDETRGVYIGITASAIVYLTLGLAASLDLVPGFVVQVALLGPVLVNGHWAFAFFRFWSTQVDRASSGTVPGGSSSSPATSGS